MYKSLSGQIFPFFLGKNLQADFNFSYTTRCVVASCGFNMCFPNDVEHLLKIFLMFIFERQREKAGERQREGDRGSKVGSVLTAESRTQGSKKKKMGGYSLESSLYTLDTSSLSEKCFGKILLWYVPCLFILNRRILKSRSFKF